VTYSDMQDVHMPASEKAVSHLHWS